MTIPTAIKRSSTPVPSQQKGSVGKAGSATAQKVDQALRRSPDAEQIYLFRKPGYKELSTQSPGSGAKKINADTRLFLRDLGIESLFDENPEARAAAEFVALSAQTMKEGEPFEVTPKFRAAVRTLADPSSGAFAAYLRREEKNQFLQEAGFGKNLLQRGKEKLKSDFVKTPFGAYALDDLAQRTNRAIAFGDRNNKSSVTQAPVKEDPLVELDVPGPAFQPVEDAEWRQRSDDWRKGSVKTTPQINAAVTAYVSQTYGGGNPFKGLSAAGQSVSNVLTYVTKGTTEKLAPGGRSTQALNQFNGITFKSRAEALHYLLWNTPFLTKAPATEANRFMKMYNELASAGL